MPSPNLPEPDDEMQKLLLEMWLLIPAAVRKACHSLDHHPDQVELDGLSSQIVELLIDNDFHTLRSFDNCSKQQTWLYTIARRHILHLLQEQKRKSSLEDLPPDSLIFQPNQEENLLLKEQRELLLAAAGKLTEHEWDLLSLMMQELKPGEIARVLGINRGSVDNEETALKKKLRRIIKDM